MSRTRSLAPCITRSLAPCLALCILGLCTCLFLPSPASAGESSVTLEGMLRETGDLQRLARLDPVPYRTVQFSSYDRRSTTADAPGWYSNADGFGGEPIPGFAEVLRAPDEKGVGLYLMAAHEGPGVIVRGWSAGMGGVLRVVLDGDATPVWEGPAYEFLARRSKHFLERAGLRIEADDAFTQTDADYFPVPFAKSLRVTWEGSLAELHFYHLQVRLYESRAKVETFSVAKLSGLDGAVKSAVGALTRPAPGPEGAVTKFEARLEPQKAWRWSPEHKGPGAVSELALGFDPPAPASALRGTRLRIAFDGAQEPAVDAPLGDFFGTGPGDQPLASLPFSISAQGQRVCRFVMPFANSISLEVLNTTGTELHLTGSIRIAPWVWDDRSLHFRARWRIDPDLLAGAGAIDLPYSVLIGRGRFVGCAAMIVNPSGVPTAGGNWWGEGDEKFLVDGETRPSTFGTGSEDYFNYSWSRPDLFDHPYCGQPLCSGPDTAGYVSNHRFQILDDIPFERSFAGYMELWAHNRTPHLSYARIAYLYARPGAVDDHRGLMPADLAIQPLPVREPQALGGATGAVFHHFEDLKPRASQGTVEVGASEIATRRKLVLWKPAKGDTLAMKLPVEKDGERSIRLVLCHRPGGATLRVLLDGKPVPVEGGGETFALTTPHSERVLNVALERVALAKGERELTLECVEPGLVGLDYLWMR